MNRYHLDTLLNCLDRQEESASNIKQGATALRREVSTYASRPDTQETQKRITELRHFASMFLADLKATELAFKRTYDIQPKEDDQ